MTALSILIGIIIGGMLFQFHGAAFGGILGWLYYSLHSLYTRQDAQQQELAWLRSRLAAHLRDDPDKASTEPVQEPQPIMTPSGKTASQPYRTAEQPDRLQKEQPRPATVAPLPEMTLKFRGPTPPPVEHTATDFEIFLRLIFNGENLLVKLGVLILFCGIAFLVKYAAQHGMFPLELRLLSAAAGGVALLTTGWRLRTKRTGYALALQGGGIGILYLVCYAAFRLYALIPATPSFALLVLISGLCAGLALLQESRTMALFGIIGGFAAPFLASVGIGDPAVLFGYYTALNIVVVSIAWFRAWRSINLTGFLATFLLSGIWGAHYYKPAHFSSVEPFLILFFLLYLGVAVLFSLRRPPDLRTMPDSILVFGTPLAALFLQSMLVSNYRYGMAWSTLVAGLCYLSCAVFLWKRDQRVRLLAEIFLALAGILLSLTIPLAFDGSWTSAVWAMEGATLLWLGFRTERRILRASGYLLQLLSGIAFFFGLEHQVGIIPLLNSYYQGCLLLSMAGLYSALLLYRQKDRILEWEQPLEYLLLAWGLCWWSGGILYELQQHIPIEVRHGVQLLCIALSAVLIRLSSRRLQWQALGWTSLLLLPLMVGVAIDWLPIHPLGNGGWFAWPIAFVAAGWLLYSLDAALPKTIKPYPHAILVWLFALLGTLELGWQIHFIMLQNGSWLEISQVVMPICLLTLILLGSKKTVWPFRQERTTYLGVIALPLAAWPLCWVVYTSFTCSGDSSPFPWLPLLNQLDLTIVAACAIALLWLRRLHTEQLFQDLLHELRPTLVALFGTIGFIWLNAVLARCLYNWGGISFTFHAMLHSPLAQASFSIFWSSLALFATLYAVKNSKRPIWICGATLLGVVVVKLFMVDLAGHGTVARIVSFVAVGLLLLIIGWVAPVPPKKE